MLCIIATYLAPPPRSAHPIKPLPALLTLSLLLHCLAQSFLALAYAGSCTSAGRMAQAFPWLQLTPMLLTAQTPLLMAIAVPAQRHNRIVP